MSHHSMSPEAGGKRCYNEGRWCRFKQSNVEDPTTGPSGSLRDFNLTHDLPALKVTLL